VGKGDDVARGEESLDTGDETEETHVGREGSGFRGQGLEACAFLTLPPRSAAPTGIPFSPDRAAPDGLDQGRNGPFP